MASVNLSSNVTRSWLLGYKFLVLSYSEFMVSYILFSAGCLVKVSLKLCFGDKVPTTLFFKRRILQKTQVKPACTELLKSTDSFSSEINLLNVLQTFNQETNNPVQIH